MPGTGRVLANFRVQISESSDESFERCLAASSRRKLACVHLESRISDNGGAFKVLQRPDRLERSRDRLVSDDDYYITIISSNRLVSVRFDSFPTHSFSLTFTHLRSPRIIQSYFLSLSLSFAHSQPAKQPRASERASELALRLLLRSVFTRFPWKRVPPRAARKTRRVVARVFPSAPARISRRSRIAARRRAAISARLLGDTRDG